MSGLGIRLLNPWLVAIGTVFMATWPIGARELRSTEPAGKTFAEQLASPVAVSFRDVVSMNGPSRTLRSAGVAQSMSPSQKSGTELFGVAPDTISQDSPSGIIFTGAALSD